MGFKWGIGMMSPQDFISNFVKHLSFEKHPDSYRQEDNQVFFEKLDSILKNQPIGDFLKESINYRIEFNSVIHESENESETIQITEEVGQLAFAVENDSEEISWNEVLIQDLRFKGENFYTPSPVPIKYSVVANKHNTQATDVENELIITLVNLVVHVYREKLNYGLSLEKFIRKKGVLYKSAKGLKHETLVKINNRFRETNYFNTKGFASSRLPDLRSSSIAILERFIVMITSYYEKFPIPHEEFLKLIKKKFEITSVTIYLRQKCLNI